MIDIVITVRLNPAEPPLGAGPTVYADLVGNPVIAVGSLEAVDPARVGEAILGLLRAAEIDSKEL